MSTSILGSSKSLTGKTIGIALAAGIAVLAIIGWTAGWFGGSEPAPAPAAAVEQPAAGGTAPAAPAAGQEQGAATQQ